MPEVICLGILVADVVGRPIRKIPERGKLALVDDIELHTGGCATNTGFSMAKLGIKVGIIGKTGADGFGDFLIREMERYGVDARGVVQDPTIHTSSTMVLVDEDGERSFLHYLGGNGQLVEEDIDTSLFEGAKILHIAGSLLIPKLDGEPTAHILKKAKEMGLTTSLDTAWDDTGRWMSALEPALEYLDVFLPSIEEAIMLTGREEPSDIADFLLNYGIKIVGLKMGERGCYIKTAREEYAIPIYKVEVVDATGAGDAFVAGFLTGLVEGWDLEKTGKFANAVGACCVTAMGATQGVKSFEETLRMIE